MHVVRSEGMSLRGCSLTSPGHQHDGTSASIAMKEDLDDSLGLLLFCGPCTPSREPYRPETNLSCQAGYYLRPEVVERLVPNARSAYDLYALS